jgi:hypothetical protein
MNQDFECPRCGHCCQALVDADDTSQERVARYGLAREIESKLKDKNGG